MENYFHCGSAVRGTAMIYRKITGDSFFFVYVGYLLVVLE